jgi:hypothetical protein
MYLCLLPATPFVQQVNDVLKARCTAGIRVELIDPVTGQPLEEKLPDITLQVPGSCEAAARQLRRSWARRCVVTCVSCVRVCVSLRVYVCVQICVLDGNLYDNKFLDSGKTYEGGMEPAEELDSCALLQNKKKVGRG